MPKTCIRAKIGPWTIWQYSGKMGTNIYSLQVGHVDFSTKVRTLLKNNVLSQFVWFRLVTRIWVRVLTGAEGLKENCLTLSYHWWQLTQTQNLESSTQFSGSLTVSSGSLLGQLSWSEPLIGATISGSTSHQSLLLILSLKFEKEGPNASGHFQELLENFELYTYWFLRIFHLEVTEN